MTTNTADQPNRREEKEVPIRLKDIVDVLVLQTLCLDHSVMLIFERGDYLTLRLTESSDDLPGFAQRIAELGLLQMPEKKREEYLHDLSTLECP